MATKYLLYIVFLISGIIWGCEKYEDDPDYPASDFIAEGSYRGAYWPTREWKSCAPEEVGMKPGKLKEMNEEMRLLMEMKIGVESYIIIKDGYIVAEQYYSDEYSRDSLHRIYSCTKSLTSALVGIARREGLIGDLDTRMIDFFPGRSMANPSPEKEQITLEHLLTMSAGMEWTELEYPYGDPQNTFSRWQEQGGGIQFVLDLPMVAAPGEEYCYNTGASHLLSAIVQSATGMRADSFALKYLFQPIGIDRFYWPVDDEGVSYGGSGARLTLRDMARFGYLYLNNGFWEDRQIIPEDWVVASQQKHMKRKYIENSYYGYQFWVSDYGTYSAVGFGGQWIMVVPDHNLVFACNNHFEEGESFQWETPERLLTTYILPAIK